MFAWNCWAVIKVIAHEFHADQLIDQSADCFSARWNSAVIIQQVSRRPWVVVESFENCQWMNLEIRFQVIFPRSRMKSLTWQKLFFCNLTSDCTWPANAWHLLLRLHLVKVIASKSNDQVNRCDSATHVRHAETLVFNRWKRVTYTPTGSVLGVGRAGQLHHTWNACWFQHSKTDSGQAWSRSDYHVSGQ